MIELIRELIRIESISGNETELVDFLERHLIERFPGHVQRDDRNLLVSKGVEEGSPTLLLCSHIDTVSPADAWTKDPFSAEQEGEKIYGLGANDALASVVSMIEALDQSVISQGRVILSIVCEEEKGAAGFCRIEPTLPRYDYAIFGEPTGMKIGNQMRGGMKLRMISRGKACHASRPWEGNSAFDRLVSDIQLLRQLDLNDDSPWGQATVEPTIIEGGQSQNQIPDRIDTILDVRPTKTKDNQMILDMLTQAGIEYEVIVNRRRPMTTGSDSELLVRVLQAHPDPELYAFGGSCDMAFSTAPSIVMGPGASERSHAPDEYILESELAHAVSVYRPVIECLTR